MKNVKLVLGFAISLSLIGQGLVPELFAADEAKTSPTVEVLIFSGRPNPTWQLKDTNRLHALKGKLKELPAVFEKEPAEWSRLGFAGFLIRGGEAGGLPGEIRVYQGVIKTGRGKEAKYLRDSQGLEQSLIAEAKKQALDAPVREAIVNYENARKAAQ